MNRLISAESADEFEKKIYAMFDSVWDCKIEHPVFDDTVGDMMRAVIQCYKKLSAQQEVKPIEYKECALAMMRMWVDNVLTDGEYGRIMDKLNAHWRKKNG